MRTKITQTQETQCGKGGGHRELLRTLIFNAMTNIKEYLDD